MRAASLFILLTAVTHEMLWQIFPAEIQGDIRYVTAWPMICSLCLLGSCFRHRFLKAVCAAVVVMTSTTAGCSAYWLMTRFTIEPGQESCTKQWGFPVMLSSCVVALAVFWWWGGENRNE